MRLRQLNKRSSFFPFHVHCAVNGLLRSAARKLGFASPYSVNGLGEKRTPINNLSIGEKWRTNLGKCSFTFTSTHFLISKCKTHFRAFQQFYLPSCHFNSCSSSPPHRKPGVRTALAHHRDVFKILFCRRKIEWGPGLFLNNHH